MLLYKGLGNVVRRGRELVVLFTGGCCNAYLYGGGLTGRCSVMCGLGYGCPECDAYMYRLHFHLHLRFSLPLFLCSYVHEFILVYYGRCIDVLRLLVIVAAQE